MNAIQLLNNIKARLDELSDTNNRLLADHRDPSSLDKALLTQQCVELYKLVMQIEAKDVMEAPLLVNEPVIQEKEEQKAEPVEEFILKAEPVPVEMPEELPAEKNEETRPEKKHEITAPEPDAVPTLFNTPPADRQEKEETTMPRHEVFLHEKISGTRHPDINARINEARVESLKAAISLNKKIAFVNDLFKENTVDYAKAIDKLNTSADVNEALRYFNELKHHYAWSNENELVVELEQLIQKRFR